MRKRNNLQLTDGRSFSDIITSNFSKLSEEQKSTLLNQMSEEKRKGILDKFFGDKCVQTYIAFLLCLLLLIIGVLINIIEYKQSKAITFEIWNTFCPIITLSLGYMFGKKG